MGDILHEKADKTFSADLRIIILNILNPVKPNNHEFHTMNKVFLGACLSISPE